MSPNRSIFQRQIEVLFHGEEGQPENLSKFHSHRERIDYTRVLLGHEVHGNIDTSFDDIASTVEQIEVDRLRVLQEAPVLGYQRVNLVVRLCARILDGIQVVRDVEEEIKSFPDIKVVEPILGQDESRIFSIIVETLCSKLALSSIVAESYLRGVGEADSDINQG